MSSSPGVESTPFAAVSSLRSRFEQLAVDPVPSRPTSAYGLLTPDDLTLRPRALSGSSGSLQVNNSNHIRASTSSSDLKGIKRPPPPPPSVSRGTSRQPSPVGSPPLHSTDPANNHISSSSISNISSITRKPPPPPPSLASSSYADLEITPSGGVASLVNKFAGTANVLPLPSISTDKSLSVIPATPTPLHSESPFFGDIDSDIEMTVSREPPPLPSRPSAVHDRMHSVDSLASSSSDASFSRVPPPPPPSRTKALVLNSPSNSSKSSLDGSSGSNPPPLPRRPTISIPSQDPPSTRHTPVRNQSSVEPPVLESAPTVSSPISAPSERKSFGTLPPPPKRTIGLGDELPELKRQCVSDSSDDEEEEEETRVKVDLPDISRACRRPPVGTFHSYSEQQINIPAYHGMYAVAGHVVVVGVAHGLKVYDLSVSDSPIWSLDTKDIAPDHRSRKVTSLEFRLPLNSHDRGCLLWIGTKEGHIFEMDVRTATLVSAKMAAHGTPIINIFRHGRSMITMDDNGKVLIFSTDTSGEDVNLSKTQPKVMRIADKQTFCKIIGGQLWTSAREPHGGTVVPGGTSRGPVVRVYDIFSPGSIGKSLLPLELVGTVTCGTILPSTPDLVYLGHEGGNITVWSLNTPDGVPVCTGTIKVSMSDIICLTAVNDRLWSGSRTGHIATYDITSRPWVMTNNWMAHNTLPVTSICVDPWSIEKVGKLRVVSVGRDERLRLWDGLLAVNWVDQELVKYETSFSTYRALKVLLVSWNVDANKPEALTGAPENVNFLHNVLTSAGIPDIISFGFQEMVDLESRRTAAKSVLLGSRTKSIDGSMTQKVSTSYRKWNDQLVSSVRLAMPDVPYCVVHSESLVGLYTCIFVKNSVRTSMKDIHVNTVKCGMGGKYGNKGAIIGRFVIDDSSLCFINCHLAAGLHQTRQRGRDIAAILEEKALFPENAIVEPIAFTNGGDGSMVLDHEIVFLSGDMNYRIDQRRDTAIALIRSGEHQSMHTHDQLLKEMRFNRGFRLRSFLEGALNFIPTYKYDPRTSEFDSSPKKRTPAWCDRILWRTLDHSRVKQTQYRRWEANISDHRPISGAFDLTVKSINHETRAMVKSQVEGMWREHEKAFLTAARQFYIGQMLL